MEHVDAFVHKLDEPEALLANVQQLLRPRL
jgi:hypothetical protein